MASPASRSRPGRATWTDDYLADDSFTHEAQSDGVVRELGIRAVVAAPLLGEDGPVGAIGVFAEAPGAFDADAGELLGLLADQAAIVLANASLNAEADVTAEKLAHQVEAQRTLGEIAASITSLRDPSAVLSRAVAETKRLLDAEHVVIHQVRAGTRELADYREVFGHRELKRRSVTRRSASGRALPGEPSPRAGSPGPATISETPRSRTRPALMNGSPDTGITRR